MNDHVSRQLLGKKDLSVTLLPGKSSGISDSTATSQDTYKQFSTDLTAASSGDANSPIMQIQASSDNLAKLGFRMLFRFIDFHANNEFL